MAQADIFLKIDGIQGESADSKHKNDIDVYSFSWGARNDASLGMGGGGGAGKVVLHDVTLTMPTSKASPVLMLACASGRHIKKAELFFRKSGGDQQEYLKITLSDLMVTSYQISGTEGGSRTMETVSLGYTQVEQEYRPQKADGTLDAPVKAGWNRATNVKV